MIKLTWGEINNPVFMQAFQHLMNSRVPGETTIKLLTLARRINNEKTLINAFADKYKGNKEELEKGVSHEFEIKVPLIPSLHLKNVSLSVGELLSLAPLLEDADDILPPTEEPLTNSEVENEAKQEVQKEAQA